MNQEHVIYGLSEEERELIPRGESYLEIWAGLPEVEFERSESTGGQMGLHHKSRDLYIWVPPPAAKAISRNPQTLLMVSGDKKGERLDRSPRRSFYWLDLPSDYMYGRDLEEFVCNVQESNNKKMERALLGRKLVSLYNRFDSNLRSLTEGRYDTCTSPGHDLPDIDTAYLFFWGEINGMVRNISGLKEGSNAVKNYFKKVLRNLADHIEREDQFVRENSDYRRGLDGNLIREI